MATRIIDDSKLNDIAVAIQEKDSGGQMTVDDMPTRIANIPSGGATLIPKTITQNGVYNASSDNADGYDVVTVDVPEKNTLDEYFANTLEVANIPSATSISTSMFSGKNAIRTIIMPNVTSIGDYAFSNCNNLALSSLPNGLTHIGRYAFIGCPISITYLPNSIKTLANAIFSGVSTIPYLDFSHFTHIPAITADTFFNTSFPFYFRDQQQLDEWSVATNWSTYADRFQIKPSGVI